MYKGLQGLGLECRKGCRFCVSGYGFWVLNVDSTRLRRFSAARRWTLPHSQERGFRVWAFRFKDL